MSISDASSRLASVMCWLSALITQTVIGYAVAPVLFAQLDKETAGTITGLLLNGVEGASVALVLAGALLWHEKRMVGLSVAVVLLQGVQLLYLNPAMGHLKKLQAAESSQFMLLHGLSQGVYLLGVLLLVSLLVLAWRTWVRAHEVA